LLKRCKLWAKERICCILFGVSSLLVLIWYLNREEVVYKFTDPSAFEAVPENFDALDEFLLSQKPDPLDRHNITLMMGLERFTKDNLRRVMQKNWNTTLFPLYGGSILRPLRRKILLKVQKRALMSFVSKRFRIRSATLLKCTITQPMMLQKERDLGKLAISSSRTY